MLESTFKKNRRIPGIYLIPNLLTMASLFAGFYAIIASMRGYYDSAAIAIFLAILMDGLDGRVARLMHVQSDFGAQLDSLADMVSFGITPAMVMYTWSLSVLGKPGWLAAFFYAACTALRLARFNTQLGSPDKRYFQGLATPAAAALVAGLVWTATNYDISGASIAWLVLCVALVLALLKVSAVRYRSFKDFDVKERIPFAVSFVVVLVIVFISFDPSDILLVATFLYVLSGPLGTLWTFFKHKSRKKQRRLKRMES